MHCWFNYRKWVNGPLVRHNSATFMINITHECVFEECCFVCVCSLKKEEEKIHLKSTSLGIKSFKILPVVVGESEGQEGKKVLLGRRFKLPLGSKRVSNFQIRSTLAYRL